MPNFEFLRDIAALVDGIPAENFDLNIYRDGLFQPCKTIGLFQPICKTIGCAAGFMSLHPDPKINLKTYSPTQWRIKAATVISGDNLLWSNLHFKAWKLFELPLRNEEDVTVDHKTIFARRVIKYLQDHNQSVSAEYLAKYAAKNDGTP